MELEQNQETKNRLVKNFKLTNSGITLINQFLASKYILMLNYIDHSILKF